MYKASPNQTKGHLSSRYKIRRFLKMKCLEFDASFIPLQILEAQVKGLANGSSFPAFAITSAQAWCQDPDVQASTVQEPNAGASQGMVEGCL